MPTIPGAGLLRDIAKMPCSGTAFRHAERFRRAAIDLIEREGLLAPAYRVRIIPLDAPPDNVLRVGGEVLDAARLIPDNGQLTALACGVCTLGPGIERRLTTLVAERRRSLALALDKVANDLLFVLVRRAQDRLIAEARTLQLTVAGELRAGDPGLPLDAQSAVWRLSGGNSIGVTVTEGQALRPLKSISMVLGVGIDLPAVHWSRCDDCPSAPKCRMSATPREGLSGAP